MKALGRYTLKPRPCSSQDTMCWFPCFSTFSSISCSFQTKGSFDDERPCVSQGQPDLSSLLFAFFDDFVLFTSCFCFKMPLKFFSEEGGIVMLITFVNGCLPVEKGQLLEGRLWQTSAGMLLELRLSKLCAFLAFRLIVSLNRTEKCFEFWPASCVSFLFISEFPWTDVRTTLAGNDASR